MKKLIALLLLVLLLSGCPGAPLAWKVNLMDKIETKTGSFNIELPFTTGEYDLLSFVGANKSGEYKVNVPIKGKIPLSLPIVAIPVDFTDQEISVELTAATIKYQILLRSIGDLRGNISVQAYLTDENTDLESADSKLGEQIIFDLSKDEQVFTREVVLTAKQLKGINERKLKIGFKVSGNMEVVRSGVVGVAYELQTLGLKDMKFAFDEKMPDADGEIADFSDAEPIPPQVVGLRLDYTLGLNHDGDFSGITTAQVYVAPIDETDIFQEKYIFGNAKDIDMSKNEQDISGSASVNSIQLNAARKDQKLRVGLRLIGKDVAINKGGNITFEYELKKADLTAYFTIL